MVALLKEGYYGRCSPVDKQGVNSCFTPKTMVCKRRVSLFSVKSTDARGPFYLLSLLFLSLPLELPAFF